MSTYLKNKWKFIAIWNCFSIAVCVLISLAQTLSREITLDNVRAYDFKIVKAAINREKEAGEYIFQEVASVLVTKNGALVLFPLAIITNDRCIQNGDLASNNKICELFENIDQWQLKTKSENINAYYGIRYRFFNKEVYMYAEVGPNKLLVGQAGHYLHLHGDDIAQINEFFSNRLLNNYINSISGISSIYYKSKWSMIIFFLGSMFALGISLFYIVKKERRHAKELHFAKNRAAEKEIQCQLLQTKIDDSSCFISEQKDKIEALGIRLKNNEIELDKYEADTESLLNELVELEEKHRMLHVNLTDIESEKHRLISKVELATSRLDNINQAKVELQSYQSKYNKIIKLWDSSTKWSQRKEIEESVSAKQRLPFTLSTAFIAFEAWVDDWYKDIVPPNMLDESTTLREKIDIVIRRLPDLQSTLHEIRIARNAWFHNGRIPEKGLVTKLLSVINNIEPRI